MRNRPRRNRRTPGIRRLVRETVLRPGDLIMPLFVIEGTSERRPIATMPGIERLTVDLVGAECRGLYDLGVQAVAPFPAVHDALKNKTGTESLNPDGLYQRTIRAIKAAVPEMVVFGDVALDPYSSDGHDGLLGAAGEILNDETLPLLGRMAVAQAQAGVDFVAPSDMMDFRVKFIRDALDQAGYSGVGILSYTAKYASSFYGPFRDALDSAPRSGDKKTYQMDPSNIKEALRELRLDTEEGADMVMVKPGLAYLDVVREFALHSELPVAVFNVSGEYAMLRAAAAAGMLNYEAAVKETLLAFKRAGASIILTYHAREFAEWQARDRKSYSSPST